MWITVYKTNDHVAAWEATNMLAQSGIPTHFPFDPKSHHGRYHAEIAVAVEDKDRAVGVLQEWERNKPKLNQSILRPARRQFFGGMLVVIAVFFLSVFTPLQEYGLLALVFGGFWFLYGVHHRHTQRLKIANQIDRSRTVSHDQP
jgi:hypothetical protein